MRRPARRSERGFSLLEVLIALSVTTLTLIVVFRLFGTALGATERAERLTYAVLIAESKLAELGASEPLRPGRTGGALADGYRWIAEVRDFDGISHELRERLPVRAYEVAVTVVWSPDDRSRFTLRTLKLKPRGRDD